MSESANHRQKEAKRTFKQILKAEDPEMLEKIKRQLPFALLIMVLLMLYIGNRYGCQCDMIELDNLKTELADVNYQLLNSTSDVSARSKPSYIEERVGNSDQGLRTSVDSPYKLNKVEHNRAELKRKARIFTENSQKQSENSQKQSENSQKQADRALKKAQKRSKQPDADQLSADQSGTAKGNQAKSTNEQN